MKIDDAFFGRFIHNLGEYLGDKCEIVVHDYRNGFDHTIVDIVNGKLSGRSLGDSPRGGLIMNYGREIEEAEDSTTYFFNGDKGQVFKSCTTFVADDDGKVIGAVCVNMDVSDFILAQNALQNFVKQGAPEYDSLIEGDVLVKNVDEVLLYYLEQSEGMIGKPMPLMNKEEKIKALQYLDSKGVFKISKANVLLCDAFQVSKYTLYSYLDEARNGKNTKDEG